MQPSPNDAHALSTRPALRPTGSARITPPLLTEETPGAETEHFYYSAQKAELEEALKTAVDGSETETFVFRPPLSAAQARTPSC